MFIDVNAERARRYMAAYGAEPAAFRQDRSQEPAACRMLNERAAVREPLTVDEVLADRIVVAPLTRAMCGGIVDGAACLLLMEREVCGDIVASSGATRVVASAVVSGVQDGSSRRQRDASRRARRL